MRYALNKIIKLIENWADNPTKRHRDVLRHMFGTSLVAKKRSKVLNGNVIPLVLFDELENVLFDDGRIRVTPALIQIGEGKRIVVSQIREFQWGRIKEDRVGWVICKILLILLIGGTLIFGLLQMWLYFSLCLIGIIKLVWYLWKWPYCVSIRTSGLFGENIDFSDRQAVDACGKAIEDAIKNNS